MGIIGMVIVFFLRKQVDILVHCKIKHRKYQVGNSLARIFSFYSLSE